MLKYIITIFIVLGGMFMMNQTSANGYVSISAQEAKKIMDTIPKLAM